MQTTPPTFTCSKCGLTTPINYSNCPHCGNIKWVNITIIATLAIVFLLIGIIFLIVMMNGGDATMLVCGIPMLGLGGFLGFGAVYNIIKGFSTQRRGGNVINPSIQKPQTTSAQFVNPKTGLINPDSVPLMAQLLNQVSNSMLDSLVGDNRKEFESALATVIELRNVDMVEKAIRQRTGKPDFQFYKPQGMFVSSPDEVMAQILEFSKTGQFTQEAELIQSLIPKVGLMNNELMDELLKISVKDLSLYQLLGVQMQLRR
jgi:hypothetical protein